MSNCDCGNLMDDGAWICDTCIQKEEDIFKEHMKMLNEEEQKQQLFDEFINASLNLADELKRYKEEIEGVEGVECDLSDNEENFLKTLCTWLDSEEE
jgi:hypothetical protein